jgi:hypothetical protein
MVKEKSSGVWSGQIFQCLQCPTYPAILLANLKINRCKWSIKISTTAAYKCEGARNSYEGYPTEFNPEVTKNNKNLKTTFKKMFNLKKNGDEKPKKTCMGAYRKN